jgi:hypothetical protein
MPSLNRKSLFGLFPALGASLLSACAGSNSSGNSATVPGSNSTLPSSTTIPTDFAERAEALATSARRSTLSASDRATLKASNMSGIDQPIGASVPIKPGVHQYSGTVSFKLKHRVMTGRAKAFYWGEGGNVRAIGGGPEYKIAIVPDLTNQQVSSLSVDDVSSGTSAVEEGIG